MALPFLRCFRKKLGSVTQQPRDGGDRVPGYVAEAPQAHKLVRNAVPVGGLCHLRRGSDLLQPGRGKSRGSLVGKVDRDGLLRGKRLRQGDDRLMQSPGMVDIAVHQLLGESGRRIGDANALSIAA